MEVRPIAGQFAGQDIDRSHDDVDRPIYGFVGRCRGAGSDARLTARPYGGEQGIPIRAGKYANLMPFGHGKQGIIFVFCSPFDVVLKIYLTHPEKYRILDSWKATPQKPSSKRLPPTLTVKPR
jgi:hypothetical protein